MEREEACGGEERERHEVDAPVGATPGRDAGGVGEHGVEGGRHEDEPEMRGMVLPANVGRRRRQEDGEAEQRGGQQGREQDQLRAGRGVASSARYAWTPLIARAPAPTAEATRFTERDVTSPAAKTPGIVVSLFGPVTT
jgi:hypothetical protein